MKVTRQNRASAVHAANRDRIEREREDLAKRKNVRMPVDYSAQGAPLADARPITVAHDGLLERLQGGKR